MNWIFTVLAGLGSAYLLLQVFHPDFLLTIIPMLIVVLCAAWMFFNNEFSMWSGYAKWHGYLKWIRFSMSFNIIAALLSIFFMIVLMLRMFYQSLAQ